jgi:hypothetical protein
MAAKFERIKKEVHAVASLFQAAWYPEGRKGSPLFRKESNPWSD